MKKVIISMCAIFLPVAAMAATNNIASLTAAAESVAGDCATVIAAGLAIFLALFGIRYLKKALRAGA